MSAGKAVLIAVLILVTLGFAYWLWKKMQKSALEKLCEKQAEKAGIDKSACSIAVKAVEKAGHAGVVLGADAASIFGAGKPLTEQQIEDIEANSDPGAGNLLRQLNGTPIAADKLAASVKSGISATWGGGTQIGKQVS